MGGYIFPDVTYNHWIVEEKWSMSNEPQDMVFLCLGIKKVFELLGRLVGHQVN